MNMRLAIHTVKTSYRFVGCTSAIRGIISECIANLLNRCPVRCIAGVGFGIEAMIFDYMMAIMIKLTI